MRNKVVLKINLFGLCENAWFQWQPIIRSKLGQIYKINVFSASASLDNNSWCQNEAYTQVFHLLTKYTNYLIRIFMNINENLKI